MLAIYGIFTGALCIFLAIKIFPILKLLDFPERYGLQRNKIPYPGGIILSILAIILCVYFQWYGIAGAIGITTIISFFDDLFQIPAIIRLITQLIIAGGITIILGIKIQQIGNPLGTNAFILPATLSTLVTIVWIVLVQNALNWFDGLKGLCVGISGVGFIALGLFGLIRPEVAWEADLPTFLNITFALSGLCAGSWFLFFRGKILLGDSGSQVLGLLLGILSIAAGTKLATTLLVLSLPLLDATVVVLRRIFLDRKSPFTGDQRHIHHTLAKQIGEKKAVILLLFCSSVLGIGSIFLSGWGKIIGIIVVGGILLVIHFQVKSKKLI